MTDLQERAGEGTMGVRIAECDIDQLLVEELSASPQFLQWFVQQVAQQTADLRWASEGMTLTGVRAHVYEGGAGAGETDIKLGLRLSGDAESEHRRLLIEDKICAAFTPEQPQRYRVRAAAAVAAGECSCCATVLVAPERYMSTPQVDLFDVRITMEQIGAYFLEQDRLSAGGDADHHRQRREQIEMAIEAARAGYVLEVDEVNTDFWRAYRSFMADHTPSLRSRASEDRGRWALDVYYEQLPNLRGWSIKHSLQNGRVMIELLGWGAFLTEVKTAVGGLLDSDMHIGHARKARSAGTTIHIWIDVPAVNTRTPFEQQVTEVSAGLSAAVRLQSWCCQHIVILSTLTAQIRTLRKSAKQHAVR